jgi:hypothetical protein
MPSRSLRVICAVRPSVDFWSLRMVVQLEDLNDAFPYGPALKRLLHRHTFNVRGLDAMQAVNHVS